MPVPPDIGLSPSQRDAVEAALDVDPDLAAELQMIGGKLRPEASRVFWRAFAEAASGRDRPAAAVLAALERAAGVRDENPG